MSDSELAWAAGFFDGEGYTGYQSQKGGIACELAQASDPSLLFRFLAAVRVGRIHSNHSAKDASGVWRWRADGISDVQEALGRLWPWLGAIKKEQASAATNAWLSDPRKRRFGRRWELDDPTAPLCTKGHQLTRENAYRHPDGRTRCRRCMREYRRRWREQNQRANRSHVKVPA